MSQWLSVISFLDVFILSGRNIHIRVKMCCGDGDSCSSLERSPMDECNRYLFWSVYGSFYVKKKVYFMLLMTVFFQLLLYFLVCIILHHVTWSVQACSVTQVGISIASQEVSVGFYSLCCCIFISIFMKIRYQMISTR